ncbi:hypothetical protein KL933_002878 [Ogataea haglerorum]|uniref:Pre-rRNA-processing protein RIX1 N-terminal domain-containing protein n=1 Tax=Ogataea haglerorum TaxID=1937702 RepID=A0AAN6D6D3_9ASCO|nr:hypothetical protein KL913_002686 [Ogataea haglerorum]KAG7718052.1 hypothetical protein KL949_003024 [Ogataea haglerorum]KAG7727169.1 hypothetical protein KL933_002878 [Ogataea haglerorum]KAG7732939.1 hypothetical protein KL948_001442 [Ogataea haglerorum]KAG7771523.1 hypothetical protein KL931_001221 [Ogataea haglerorum]
MSEECFPLSSVLPYMEGSKIEEIDLGYLLSTLARPSTISNASKTDLNHLCARVNNYLSSNNAKHRWLGSKMAIVLNTHIEITASEYTSKYLGALIRVLESKCFVKDEASAPVYAIVTLESCCDALSFIINNIRGKHALTREMLTPKLPSIIGSLLEIINLVPQKAIDLLYDLLKNNSTTFRPFGSKFERALLGLLGSDGFNKFEQRLQHKILKSLVLLSFSLTKNSTSELWRTKFNHYVQETKSVIQIYSEFMSLDEDEDLTQQLNALPSVPEKFEPHFPPLDVDLNESPLQIMKIVSRVDLLVNLLIEFLQVPTPQVKAPVGYLLMIGQILVGINHKFTPIKRDIRDVTLRQIIAQSATLMNHVGLKILNVLPNIFGGDLLPHLNSVLSSVDTLIPVSRVNGRIIVDEVGVLDNPELIFAGLKTRINFLELVEGFANMSLLHKSIDAALILSKPRIPQGVAKTSEQRLKNVSMSDLLSDQKTFITEATHEQKNVLRQYFKVLLTKCVLNYSKQSEILRLIILDAVKGAEVKELLYAALLYPHKEAHASVLPMVKQLLNDDELVSVFLNPRLPVLPTKRVVDQALMEESEQEREEEEEERRVKKIKIEEMETTEAPAEDNRKEDMREEKKETLEANSNGDVSDYESMIFKPVGPLVENQVAQPSVENEKLVEAEQAPSAQSPPGSPSDDESDFEIPEIDIDDD